jgi:hypothetical protein
MSDVLLINDDGSVSVADNGQIAAAHSIAGVGRCRRSTVSTTKVGRYLLDPAQTLLIGAKDQFRQSVKGRHVRDMCTSTSKII